jgi:hypothetical protein
MHCLEVDCQTAKGRETKMPGHDEDIAQSATKTFMLWSIGRGMSL